MREIKFRGKRLDNGEWVDGFVLFKQDKSEAVIAKLTDTESVCENVDPATVGQFTGLQDKNGNVIYEGDILCQEDRMFHFVEWCRHLAQFRGICHELESAVDILSLVLMNYKVIGNIHDNPELLEQ